METLLGQLQALSVEWRSGKTTLQQQVQYLHVLRQLEHCIACLTPATVQVIINAGAAAHCVAIATEHALLGVLPWITLHAWCNTLRSLLQLVHRATSLAHLVPSLWTACTKLAKDQAGTSSSHSVTSLCAGLLVLRVLLVYCPVELTALRKHLPHPVKTVSVTARVCGFNVVPWVVLNLKQPSQQSAASSSFRSAGGPTVMLNAEFYEYYRKGLVSTEYAVREAAIEAVRTTLELGVAVDPATASVLFEALVVALEDTGYTSLQLQEDAGAALGYLLAFFQSGHSVNRLAPLRYALAVAASSSSGGVEDSPRLATVPTIPWQYLGGVEAVEAGRVVRRLLRPFMSRAMQHALSVALAKLLQLTVSPRNVEAALRAVFVQLVPVPRDDRAYMPRLVVDALVMWAGQLMGNTARVALVNCLRRYVQRTDEEKIIVHTALTALRGIVPMLASTREVASALTHDLSAVLHAQPSMLSAVAEITAALAQHSPYLQRRLFQTFVNECHAMGSSGATSGDVSSEFRLVARTILSAPAQVQAEPGLMGPLLTALVCIGQGYPPHNVTDVHYRHAEYLFRFSQLLLLHQRPRLTPLLLEKIDVSVSSFLSLLVSSPSTTSVAFFRAANAACELLHVRGAKDFERKLCIGLLENQLMAVDDPAQPIPVTSPTTEQVSPVPRSPGDVTLGSHAVGSSRALNRLAMLADLKGRVYRVLYQAPWPECTDDASLRWLLTQALKDLEQACTHHVILDIDDEDLLPAVTIPFLRGIRRVRPASSMKSAEAGKHAVKLIAWGMEHCGLHDPVFCHDILRRLQTLIREVPRTLNQPSTASATTSASTSAATTAAAAAGQSLVSSFSTDLTDPVVCAWDVLCVMYHILARALRGPGPLQELWNASYHEHAKEWQGLVASWVATTALFDVKLIGAKVLGCLLCLTQQVDTFTTQVMKQSAPSLSTVTSSSSSSSSSAMSEDVSGMVLTLAFTHASHAVLHSREEPSVSGSGSSLPAAGASTLPLATSCVAEAAKKSDALFGDPCSLQAIAVLVSYVELAVAYPAQTGSAMSTALVAALLRPTQTSLDPLVCSLLVTLFAQMDGGQTALQSAEDLASALLHQAVSFPPWSHLHAYRAARSAEMQLVADVLRDTESPPCLLRACSRSGQATNSSAALQLRLVEALRGTTLAALVALTRHSAPVGAAGASNTNLILPEAMPSELAEGVAQLWLACVGSGASSAASLSQGGVEGENSGTRLSLVDVAVLVDAVTTASARSAWTTVAQSLLCGSPTTMASGSSSPSSRGSKPSAVLLRKLCVVHHILNARPPVPTVRPASAASTAVGEGDELAELDMLEGHAHPKKGDSFDSEAAAANAASGGGGPQEDYGDAGLGVDAAGTETILDDGDRGRKGGGPGRGAGGGRKKGSDVASTAAVAGAGGDLEDQCASSDVAAKVAMLNALVSLAERGTSANVENDPVTHMADIDAVHRVFLDVVVSSVPLSEALPDLLAPSRVLLLHVLHQLGHLYIIPKHLQLHQLASPPSSLPTMKQQPYLAEWRTQLVACLKTVVQLSVFGAGPSCALVSAFLHCNIADDGSVKRVVRGLSLLLMIMEQLDGEGRDLVSSEVGLVVQALSEVLAVASEQHWKQSAEAALHVLASSAGQAALTLLSSLLATSVAMANGYEPPVESVPVFSAAQNLNTTCDASTVLEVVGRLSEADGLLGPSLRYASGCLACLVVATDGGDLRPLPRLLPLLPTAHQTIVWSIARETLMDPELSTTTATAAAIGEAADEKGGMAEETARMLLQILTAATVSPSPEKVQELIDAVLPRQNRGGGGGRQPAAETMLPLPTFFVAGALLQLAFAASCETATIQFLLEQLPVDYVRLASDAWRAAAAAYMRSALVTSSLTFPSWSTVETTLTSTNAGLVLCEWYFATQPMDSTASAATSPISAETAAAEAVSWCSPLSKPSLSPSVLCQLSRVLMETSDASELVRFMWPCPAHAAAACDAFLGLLGSTRDLSLVAKAGPALCEMLIQLVTASGSGDEGGQGRRNTPLQDRMLHTLHYCLAVLAHAPHALALRLVLQPFGATLTQKVVKTHPLELRHAIQKLTSDDSVTLRRFMEESTTALAAAAAANNR